ncbi:LamB/YcsF family protein [Pseudidiomarina aestuarii]|uniref:LamB/YcsF family protein n=1 Tax=Pseudidiomarina aestuarii TaxID=624146 RepID=A0A6N4DH68_9GAMM|nr:LamB/YcsF family protein [Pseudidiomarina aestuarii]
MLLNCDVGESQDLALVASDQEVFPYIDLANIACGYHAGSAPTMAATIELARHFGVTIGAHPSYPDRENFGRKSMVLSDQQLSAVLHAQIGSIDRLCMAQHTVLQYVKPHGALYNDMQANLELFEQVVAVVAAENRWRPEPLKLMTLATIDQQPYADIAECYQVPLWFEAFADRRYTEDGRLRSRDYADAVLDNQTAIITQAERFARGESITTVEGEPLMIRADTLCVHGDNPAAVATVAAIRQSLERIQGSAV